MLKGRANLERLEEEDRKRRGGGAEEKERAEGGRRGKGEESRGDGRLECFSEVVGMGRMGAFGLMAGEVRERRNKGVRKSGCPFVLRVFLAFEIEFTHAMRGRPPCHAWKDIRSLVLQRTALLCLSKKTVGGENPSPLVLSLNSLNQLTIRHAQDDQSDLRRQ